MLRHVSSRAVVVAVATALIVALAVTAVAASAAPEQQRTLVGTLQADGHYSTLVSLVGEAGLAGALSADKPMTVLAPTDAAFKRVPEKTLAALKADPAKLRKVLLYHVLNGRFTAHELATKRVVMTAAGETVRVTATGKLRVNRARVLDHDLTASNGIVHAIDRVLVPASL